MRDPGRAGRRREAVQTEWSRHVGANMPFAFTLIELLVVVAIIAVLISILVPSLQQARKMALTTVCQANLHAMGTSFFVYAQDWETSPPGERNAYGRHWEFVMMRGKYLDKSEVFWCTANINKGGSLLTYTNPCVCGVDSMLWAQDEAPYFGGYGWNCFNPGNGAPGRYGVIGDTDWNDCCWYAGNAQGGLNNDSGIKLSQIKYMRSIWLFCRNSHWNALNVRTDLGPGNFDKTDYSAPAFIDGGSYADAQKAGRPAAHHIGGFNALHVDGHAQYWTYGSTTADDWTAWIK